jgi:hypothetical protein
VEDRYLQYLGSAFSSPCPSALVRAAPFAAGPEIPSNQIMALESHRIPARVDGQRHVRSPTEQKCGVRGQYFWVSENWNGFRPLAFVFARQRGVKPLVCELPCLTALSFDRTLTD